MTDNESSETSQQLNILIQRLLEIRQDGISMTLNAERGLEDLGHHVETAIVSARERRMNRRRKNRP